LNNFTKTTEKLNRPILTRKRIGHSNFSSFYFIFYVAVIKSYHLLLNLTASIDIACTQMFFLFQPNTSLQSFLLDIAIAFIYVQKTAV